MTETGVSILLSDGRTCQMERVDNDPRIREKVTWNLHKA